MSDDEALMSDDETEEFDEDLFDDDDDDFLVGGEEADEEEAAALNALAQNEQMLMLSQLMCFNNRNRQNQNRASNALAALSFMQGESDDDFEPGDDSDEGDDDDDGDIGEMESDSSEEGEEESDLLADEVINDTPVSPLLEQTKTPLQVVAETPTTPTSSFSPNFIADSTPEIRTTLNLSTPDTTPPNTRRILFTRPATLTQTKSTCNIIDREEVVEAERVKFIVLFKYSDSMQWNTDFTIAETDITGDKVREMVQSELNKRTCHFMIRRLYVIDYDFHGFEVLLDVNESFFETERLEDCPKLICAIINKPTTFT